MEYECNIQSNPPSSPDINDIVGAPQLNPRLGDEYQVEIPSMTPESERFKLLMNPADSEVVNDMSLSFAMGLPVPLIWIDNEVKDGRNKGQEHFRNNDGAVNVLGPAETSDVKPNITSDNEKEFRSITFKPVTTEAKKSCQQGQGKAYGSAPGKLNNSWSNADIRSFLLGLFIFGKNFIQIKRFLENKRMGEILSFYYGKFYKSDEHRRWSDCRKVKGRKCMTGQKLFTGWRQHELLSRLNSKVSEQVRDTLLQVSKPYAEGRASLQDYIFSLKSTVGLSTLVEVVGIGKDKADLTSLAAEPPKSNPSFSIHPCAPTSKAWSSLEPSDIMKYLTGGFRLSKAKSNDLFWEAVWPRLLARGWHSEQPNNNPGFVSSRDYLVFLIPGVKKFSRRKLVKGDHYFDSVSDVLSKVVSEPNLLELEFEEGKVGSCNEEDGWISERASDKDDQSDSYRHCYLKPRVSSFKTDHMKFTVVDTSLKHGGKSSDLRELRSLPPGFKITSLQTIQVRGKESDSAGHAGGEIEVKAAGKADKGDKHLGEANRRKGTFDSISQKLSKFTVVDTSSVHCGKLSRELRCVPVEFKGASKKMTALSREVDGILSDSSSSCEKEAITPLDDKNNSSSVNCHRDTSDGESINRKGACDSMNNNDHKIEERRQSQKISVSDDKQLKKTVKQQFSRRARSGHSTHAAPPIKRRRLTACAKAETSRILEISSEDSKSEKPGLSQPSCLPEDSQETACLIAFSVEVMEEDNKGSILNKDCRGPGMSCTEVEKCESQPLINLSSHQLPPESENGEMMEEDEERLKLNDANFTCDAHEQIQKPVGISGDGGADINPRRQSTRNRPLTVRALESMENELLYVQRKQKKKEVQTPKAPFSPCRKARTRVKTTMHRQSSSGGSSAGSMQEKHLNGDSDVNQDINKALH
ncbi:LOW QUALITY PROTEIN: uncharacterized protein LOC129312139 [Prosopis cineraria]|uniref:LOW QUALITY PROTEIN: uncharacterized protein LOC129312139 n=1 Tax=Prosopis cineraria TaxID=364024 RepID=UPI00241068D1|nr:LOW QUALITY PROTEIN: uncharacterized protein LOC129312139 [Prosopis cineraria]